jgi:hypothetical protein
MRRLLIRLWRRGPLFELVKNMGIERFVSFVLSDEARRSGSRGHRPRMPMEGPYISIQGQTTYLRGTDRSERVYVCVRSLELAGESNYEACRIVARYLDSRLGNSSRGRPRESSRDRDFLDKVETVRSLFNAFKRRHPFKAQLPERDFLLEKWWGMFIHALSAGAMNMGFYAHLDALQSGPRDAVCELGPARILLSAIELSEGKPEDARRPRPADVLIEWSDPDLPPNQTANNSTTQPVG